MRAAFSAARRRQAALPGTALPPPVGVFPLRRAEGGLKRFGSDADRQPLPSRFSGFRRRPRRPGRAASAGIGRIVTISTRVRRLGALLEIAGRFPNVYCSVGTHPHQADEEDGIPASELVELTRHPKVVALGEAGLDYFYSTARAKRRSAASAATSRRPAPPACRWSSIPAKPTRIAAASSKTK